MFPQKKRKMMKTFNTGKITFEYPVTWEVEKADILSNPDCIATLSKGQDNLINAVMFPTATNLDDYKIFMEDALTDDGGVILASDFVGVILASDFVRIADMDAIKLHANMDTPEINFDIHTYVFIENGEIFIFEMRTLDVGVILASDFVRIADMDAIKLHANMDTPEINFDIHTYVFIENGEIFIFEMRTLDVSGESEREFKDIISTFKILK